MPATYEPISSTILTSNTSSITFSNIPQIYTDITLVVNDINSTGSFDTLVRFNGDSGSNYSRTGLRGNGSTASSYSQTNTSAINLCSDGSAEYARPAIVNIINYSNTTTNKTVISRANVASQGSNLLAQLWRNTSAINSITILSSSTFASGASFSLYGIKAA